MIDIQELPGGKIIVNYGPAVEYQSPLIVDGNYPSVVTYKCAKTGVMLGKVYKNPDGRWWLATCFIPNWTPIEVFSKIEGFLLLNNLYKQHHEH